MTDTIERRPEQLPTAVREFLAGHIVRDADTIAGLVIGNHEA